MQCFLEKGRFLHRNVHRAYLARTGWKELIECLQEKCDSCYIAHLMYRKISEMEMKVIEYERIKLPI